jgi:hypothetical protein
MSKTRILADILKDYFQNSNEPLAVEFRKHFAGTEHPLLTEKPYHRKQNPNLFEVMPGAADFAQSEFARHKDTQNAIAAGDAGLTKKSQKVNFTLLTEPVGRIFF